VSKATEGKSNVSSNFVFVSSISGRNPAPTVFQTRKSEVGPDQMSLKTRTWPFIEQEIVLVSVRLLSRNKIINMKKYVFANA
jgi:hypothetical protein